MICVTHVLNVILWTYHVIDDLWYFLSLSCFEQAGVCYAFVEFEDATSAQSAIEVHILPSFLFLVTLKFHI